MDIKHFFEYTLVIKSVEDYLTKHSTTTYYIFAILIILLIALIFTVAVYANDPICKYRITFARALGSVQNSHIIQIETKFSAAELDKFLKPTKEDPTIYEIIDKSALQKAIGLEIFGMTDAYNAKKINPLFVNLTPIISGGKINFKLYVAYPKIKIGVSNKKISALRDKVGMLLKPDDSGFYVF